MNLNQYAKGGGQPLITAGQIKAFQLPIPPLPIQSKIVEILDNFTELTARKKQYEYYRDELLTFGDDVPMVRLGEVIEVCRGASPRPINQYITTESDGVNWIKIGDVESGSKFVTQSAEKITKEGAIKSRYVKKGDFILSNSMSFGRPYILGIDGYVHDGWIVMSNFEKSFIPDFLYHLLNMNEIQRHWKQKASAGGTIQNLNSDIVRATEIPLPPLSEQSRKVKILDKFNTLTTDITAGLPAEIAARQKQYAYYRDKLLTFKERA